MDAEAKKKMVTAAKQAKHAVSNLETATELQVEDIAQTVTQVAQPLMHPLIKKSMASAALVVVGAMSYHVVSTKLVIPFREKRQIAKLKKHVKDSEREDREGVDGEVVSGPTVVRRSVR